MKNITRFLIALIFFGNSHAAFSQQEPCSTPDYEAFDFWLGTWDVTGTKDGKHLGVNKITKIEKGCALLEVWEGNNGTSGHSLTYYNRVALKWHQIWVSAGEYTIDILGAPQENGSIHMTGTIWYNARNESTPFTGTWTPNSDGTVRQLFREFDEGNDIWNVWFDGTYTLQKK